MRKWWIKDGGASTIKGRIDVGRSPPLWRDDY